MKWFLTSLVMFSLLLIEVDAQKATFVRIYNIDGKKIKNGLVESTTDSTLHLKSNDDKPVVIAIKNIGSIITKHSAGNNILIGGLIGSATFAILGVASADPDAYLGYTAGVGAAAGGLLGLSLGAGIGGITALLKKTETFVINGDTSKWKAIKDKLEAKAPK